MPAQPARRQRVPQLVQQDGDQQDGPKLQGHTHGRGHGVKAAVVGNKVVCRWEGRGAWRAAMPVLQSVAVSALQHQTQVHPQVLIVAVARGGLAGHGAPPLPRTLQLQTLTMSAAQPTAAQPL